MHGGWVDVRPVSFMFGVEVPQTARESNQGQPYKEGIHVLYPITVQPKSVGMSTGR
ncbi:unnamed protein product, partial [Ascophyllum nodosum]